MRFRTDSPFIAIRAEMDLEGFPMPHMADAGQAGFDLYVKRDGDASSYVKELLDKGKSIWSIAQTLRMSLEFVQEQIYEIRKQEAIMARKPKISKEQRTEMLRLHNEERYSVGKLASKFGCSQTAVKTALQAAKIEAEEEAMKNTGINPEFDAAVDAMIAESKSADAEEPSAITEPEKLPGVVRRALDAGYAHLLDDIAERREQIEDLQAEIAEFEKDIAALKKWVEGKT